MLKKKQKKTRTTTSNYLAMVDFSAVADELNMVIVFCLSASKNRKMHAHPHQNKGRW